MIGWVIISAAQALVIEEPALCWWTEGEHGNEGCDTQGSDGAADGS